MKVGTDCYSDGGNNVQIALRKEAIVYRLLAIAEVTILYIFKETIV